MKKAEKTYTEEQRSVRNQVGQRTLVATTSLKY